MVICFGNVIFELLWNWGFVDYVQIMVFEDLGLEGCVGYYEEVGIVCDML